MVTEPVTQQLPNCLYLQMSIFTWKDSTALDSLLSCHHGQETNTHGSLGDEIEVEAVEHRESLLGDYVVLLRLDVCPLQASTSLVPDLPEPSLER